MEYILIHDLGTTGGKACLFDRRLNLVASRYRTYPTRYSKKGWAEQRPEDLWQTFKILTREIISAAKIGPGQIVALGFTGHNPSCIPVTTDGEVLVDYAPIYADLRCSRQVQTLQERLGTSPDFYALTGGGQLPEQYSIFKMMWFQEREIGTGVPHFYFLNTLDFIIQRLTGKFVTDYSLASNTGLLDIRTRQWSSPLLKFSGIQTANLPELVQSTDVVGTIEPAIAEECGLSPETRVVMGGGDVPCSALGSGAIVEGIYYANLGSAAWMGACTGQPYLDQKERVTNLCHVVPGQYVLHQVMTGAGVCYEWLAKTLFAEGLALSECFEIMENEAGEVAPGSNGIVFLPYMRGVFSGEIDPSASGAFVGLRPGSTRAELTRAVIEGIAFGLRELKERYDKIGLQATELRLVGGGAQSLLWRKIITNACAIKTVAPEHTQEASALGAALVTAVGVDWLANFESGYALCGMGNECGPQTEWIASYNQGYEKFRMVFSSLQPLFRHL